MGETAIEKDVKPIQVTELWQFDDKTMEYLRLDTTPEGKTLSAADLAKLASKTEPKQGNQCSCSN